ncbi:hypothetical protein [Peribacillus deserti]|uniref:Uncharacterized protein n=1 Tax=Peribacillus deserti TaxID=673318 RepID=A0A2N5M0L2_9BACI|nr:hypothetical protein [Peribacillus deserti]PLT27813.1 hypothetical protein CUU66_21890 [Peribacillus deserti]
MFDNGGGLILQSSSFLTGEYGGILQTYILQKDFHEIKQKELESDFVPSNLEEYLTAPFPSEFLQSEFYY